MNGNVGVRGTLGNVKHGLLVWVADINQHQDISLDSQHEYVLIFGMECGAMNWTCGEEVSVRSSYNAAGSSLVQNLTLPRTSHCETRGHEAGLDHRFHHYLRRLAL
jgi:hypothetical protein